MDYLDEENTYFVNDEIKKLTPEIIVEMNKKISNKIW